MQEPRIKNQDTRAKSEDTRNNNPINPCSIFHKDKIFLRHIFIPLGIEALNALPASLFQLLLQLQLARRLAMVMQFSYSQVSVALMFLLHLSIHQKLIHHALAISSCFSIFLSAWLHESLSSPVLSYLLHCLVWAS